MPLRSAATLLASTSRPIRVIHIAGVELPAVGIVNRYLLLVLWRHEQWHTCHVHQSRHARGLTRWNRNTNTIRVSPLRQAATWDKSRSDTGEPD